jgi:HK97 gp10 family phage protein
MNKITVDTKQLTDLINRLNKAEVKVKKVVDRYVSAAALDGEAEAKRLAPVNFGKLRQSINSGKVTEMNYKIGANVPYAAFMEFGTGAKVKVPTELKALAIQFKGGKGGDFESGLESVKDWCRSKGIDEEAAYPIFISILNNGVEPQPYLYPALLKARKILINDLKQIGKDLQI